MATLTEKRETKMALARAKSLTRKSWLNRLEAEVEIAEVIYDHEGKDHWTRRTELQELLFHVVRETVALTDLIDGMSELMARQREGSPLFEALRNALMYAISQRNFRAREVA